MSGPQASCAESGTARARASGRGSTRAIPEVSGAVRTRRAAVAATESANPSDRDIHGSSTRIAVTARASTARPTAGRPSSSAIIAIAAMTAARTTLASGVTSTTKNPRASIPAATRTPRPSPSRLAAPAAIAMTRTQFAPLTAVRCDREEVFIAASSAPSTPSVSPTESPGTSPAPGSGSPRVAATNP